MPHRLSSKLTLGLVLALLLGVALVLVGCEQNTPAATTAAQQPAATQACPTCPEAQPCPTAAACPTCPEPGPVTETPTTAACPFQEEWAASPHADAEAEAFRHWDEEDPKEVPVDCAKCHAGSGFQDFVGADGSAAGVVDKGQPVDTVIDCNTCHNQAASNWNLVTFPSGISLTVEGPDGRCLECHQGRGSTTQVNAGIERAGVADEDTSSEDLRFTNIHYYAAAATMYGTWAKGGYEYEGKTYEAKYDHVEGFDSCTDCHSPHTLELRVEACAGCHQGVSDVESLRDIRMAGSTVDFNGNGDVEEGIAKEIEGLQGMLLQAIQAYAKDVNGKPIAYSPDAYPYFLADANDNGAVDEGEEGYAGWTPRLLKAAYNYQMSIKDPGQFAHGGKYIVELLYDSIENLNTKLATPVDLSKANRTDVGHFAGDGEAWRHWDEDGHVEAGCARCHSGAGLPVFIENGANIAAPATNGMWCSTCHDDLTSFSRYQVESVTFPSGKTAALDNPDSNLCLQCHQGRESTVSVNRAIGTTEADTVSENLRFRNVHYFAAGATLFGGDVQGAYQFEGKEYVGQFKHVAAFDTCIECHSTHNLGVQAEACSGCHAGAEELTDIRMTPTDFDGDGDTTEGIAGEISTMQEALYTAMQAYAKDTAGTALIYSPSRYPYFFADANANNEIDEGEGSYATWTPALLRGAYNYQYSQKDPGTFAHNAKYILQTLYDSVEALGGDVAGMTRP